MDEELFTKVWMLLPWIIAVIVVFVIGIPWFHAVSSMDTALYQVAQMAKTGATVQELNMASYRYVGMNLPYQMDSTVLFDPTHDMMVTPDASNIHETVTLVYDDPIFAPFVSILGLSGPTVPLSFSKTITLSSANDAGVNYFQ